MDEDEEIFEPSLIADLPKKAARSYDDFTHVHLQVVIVILMVMLWRVC